VIHPPAACSLCPPPGYAREGCGLTIEQEEQSGFWGIYDKDGSRLCVYVDYKSAQKVVARLRRAKLAHFNPLGMPDFALLTTTAACIMYTGYSATRAMLCDYGKTFATRTEADAYLRGCEHILTK
jgi:hypothetical protein